MNSSTRNIDREVMKKYINSLIFSSQKELQKRSDLVGMLSICEYREKGRYTAPLKTLLLIGDESDVPFEITRWVDGFYPNSRVTSEDMQFELLQRLVESLEYDDFHPHFIELEICYIFSRSTLNPPPIPFDGERTWGIDEGKIIPMFYREYDKENWNCKISPGWDLKDFIQA